MFFCMYGQLAYFILYQPARLEVQLKMIIHPFKYVPTLHVLHEEYLYFSELHIYSEYIDIPIFLTY